MTDQDNHFQNVPPIETINNIKFTPREIDIIACLLGRRSAKKIALSLNISPKTVENHIRNIMQKLDCNSRENIIDFIERAKEASLLKQRYNQLNRTNEFDLPSNESTQQEIANTTTARWPLLKRWKFSLAACLLLIICLSSGFIYLNHNMRETQSELALPPKFALLQRPELIDEMTTKLSGREGSQTLALIGIPGAGKKVLARLYARKQNAEIVWEINAASPETSVRSFERLADALSKSDEDKQTLKTLREINIPQRKEESLVFFIREKISSFPNWILIFYNVNDFSYIEKYFPDEFGWGNGKVIITTMDNNIQNNKHVNHIVQVGELNEKQRVDLFVNIINKESSKKLTEEQLKNLRVFLNQIPPFPLDISMAAYYIKETKTPYAKYVEYLNTNNDEFNKLQEGMLKEIGEHERTRYNIIASSLNDLINTNAEYRDLFEYLTLIGTKNIPRELLYAYKDRLVVDNFIHHLNKYSLSIFTLYDLNQEIPKFSIHFSVRDNIIYYLNKNRGSSYKNSIPLIFTALEKYMNDIIQKEDTLRMQLVLDHFLNFANHAERLPMTMQGKLDLISGTLHYYLGNFIESQKLLVKGTETLMANPDQAYSALGVGLARLGNVHREFGQFEQAQSILEKGLALYQQHLPQDSMGKAYILRHLARVSRNLGDYEKAKALIDESLALYKEHPSADPEQVSHSQAYLGKIYKDLGNYAEAKKILQDCYAFSEKNHGKEHPRTARILRDLGQVYYSEGDLLKGEQLIQSALEIFEKFGHPEIYTIFENFGELHIKKSQQALGVQDLQKAGDLKAKAHDSLKQALKVVQAHFPADSYHIVRIQSKIKNIK